MKLSFLTIILFVVYCASAGAEDERLTLQIHTPSGWVLEIQPNGVGTLTWPIEPISYAKARAYTFDYYHLVQELGDKPVGDSVYRYAFIANKEQKVKTIFAPRDSPMLLKSLQLAARILYSEASPNFYKTRMNHPVLKASDTAP